MRHDIICIYITYKHNALYRQTYGMIQTDICTGIADSQTEYRQSDKQADVHTYCHADRQIDRQKDRQTNTDIPNQIDRLIDRQTDCQTKTRIKQKGNQTREYEGGKEDTYVDIHNKLPDCIQYIQLLQESQTGTGVYYDIVAHVPKSSLDPEARETLALMAARGESCDNSLVDGESSYIEKYTRGIAEVESILALDRLRQVFCYIYRILLLLRIFGKKLKLFKPFDIISTTVFLL